MKNVDNATRMGLFNQLTRQYIKPVETKAGAENSVVRFTLPKARLLSKLFLQLTCTVTATHATNTSYTPHEEAPANFIKNLIVDFNNGFQPINISGAGLYNYNILNRGKNVMSVLSTDSRGANVVQPLVASSGGTANAVKLNLQIPISLNPRDNVGMALLQSDDTLVNVNVTLGAIGDLAPASAGYTFAVSSINLTLASETFSIPTMPEAIPDLSVLKQVMERTESLNNGETIIKLPINYIYRKVFFALYTTGNVLMADSSITSFELVVQGAETPYTITPTLLAQLNNEHYKGDLPKGTFALDFSAMQGFPNFSGYRDYIDAEKITELWLRINTSAPGSIKMGYEFISRLDMQ